MKKMECSNCGGEAPVVRGTYHLKELGLKNVVLQGTEIVKCGKCGNEDPVLHRMDDIMRALALAVVGKPYRLAGDEVRFLRKYLHLTGEQFARLLRVDNTTLSKWERGEDPVGPQSDLLIRFFTVVLGEGLKEKIDDVVAHMSQIRDTRPRRRPTIEISAATLGYQYA